MLCQCRYRFLNKTNNNLYIRLGKSIIGNNSMNNDFTNHQQQQKRSVYNVKETKEHTFYDVLPVPLPGVEMADPLHAFEDFDQEIWNDMMAMSWNVRNVIRDEGGAIGSINICEVAGHHFTKIHQMQSLDFFKACFGLDRVHNIANTNIFNKIWCLRHLFFGDEVSHSQFKNYYEKGPMTYEGHDLASFKLYQRVPKQQITEFLVGTSFAYQFLENLEENSKEPDFEDIRSNIFSGELLKKEISEICEYLEGNGKSKLTAEEFQMLPFSVRIKAESNIPITDFTAPVDPQTTITFVDQAQFEQISDDNLDSDLLKFKVDGWYDFYNDIEPKGLKYEYSFLVHKNFFRGQMLTEDQINELPLHTFLQNYFKENNLTLDDAWMNYEGETSLPDRCNIVVDVMVCNRLKDKEETAETPYKTEYNDDGTVYEIYSIDRVEEEIIPRDILTFEREIDKSWHFKPWKLVGINESFVTGITSSIMDKKNLSLSNATCDVV